MSSIEQEILSGMLEDGKPNKIPKIGAAEILNPTATGNEERSKVLWDYYLTQDHCSPTAPDWFRIKMHETLPWGLCYFSDLHLGDMKAAIRKIDAEAKIVADTPGLYGEFHGDATNNWITSKLLWLQREQRFSPSEEWLLFDHWLNIVKDKLLWIVGGNHDIRTFIMGGVGLEMLFPQLNEITMLYDPNELRICIECGDYEQRQVIRHRWRGYSMYNSTHGQERAIRFGSYDFHVAVGGHTHSQTVCRPFVHQDVMRYAILTGVYKHEDRYGQELGLPKTYGNAGSGVMLYFPTGDTLWVENVNLAAGFLTWLRADDNWKHYLDDCYSRNEELGSLLN